MCQLLAALAVLCSTPTQFNVRLPYCPATDLSGVDRWYGALLLRAPPSPDQAPLAYICPMASLSGSANEPGGGKAKHASNANGHGAAETKQQGGCASEKGGKGKGGNAAGVGGAGDAKGQQPGAALPPLVAPAGCPVACTVAQYAETARAAACR